MSALESRQEPPQYMAVARVLGPHGLRGEVKLELHTDFPERIMAGRTLYMGEDKQPISIRTVRPHQSTLLVVLAGVADRTAADALRGIWLYTPLEEAAPLSADQYFVHQIIGMSVYDTTGRLLGTVDEVLVTGSNDVYVVKKPERGELLVPALEGVVQTVDVVAKQMTVLLPPGLEDT